MIREKPLRHPKGKYADTIGEILFNGVRNAGN